MNVEEITQNIRDIEARIILCDERIAKLDKGDRTLLPIHEEIATLQRRLEKYEDNRRDMMRINDVAMNDRRNFISGGLKASSDLFVGHVPPPHASYAKTQEKGTMIREGVAADASPYGSSSGNLRSGMSCSPPGYNNAHIGPPARQDLPLANKEERLMQRIYTISDIPLGIGIRGCREFIRDNLNSNRSLYVEGYVQRVKGHDVKLVIRGTPSNLDIVENFLSIYKWNCMYEEYWYTGSIVEYTINILKSERDAVSSARSPPDHDHISTSSISSAESSRKSNK